MKRTEEITVLIAEDHMSMRKIIKTVLQHIGVRHVIEATDGAEALMLLHKRNSRTNLVKNAKSPLLSERPIDFIICDWGMPRMNGLEFLSEVRASETFQTIPFIMLTAENNRELIVKAIEKGVTDYIIKPFTTSVLEAKLRATLDDIQVQN